MGCDKPRVQMGTTRKRQECLVDGDVLKKLTRRQDRCLSEAIPQHALGPGIFELNSALELLAFGA